MEFDFIGSWSFSFLSTFNMFYKISCLRVLVSIFLQNIREQISLAKKRSKSVICVNVVRLGSQMLYTKFQRHPPLFRKGKISKLFHNVWAWRPIWLHDQGHLEKKTKLSMPNPWRLHLKFSSDGSSDFRAEYFCKVHIWVTLKSNNDIDLWCSYVYINSHSRLYVPTYQLYDQNLQ